jgi:citrate synthase
MAEWITAEAALAALNVRRQTLYAYVSRGMLRAKADADDPRRSLYAASDVKRLGGRKRGARRRSDVAAGAISWGEPVLESGVSTIRYGELVFRGRLATNLAAKATLEDVARLLWRTEEAPAASPDRGRIIGATAKARAFAYLSARAAQDAPSLGRNATAHRRDAWRLLSGFADHLAGQAGDGPMHRRLAAAWGVDAKAADVIRRALVLMADHELNASTFAVRIAASTGASLAASALAGLATLSGPLHGEAAARALAQLDRLVAAKDARAEVRAMIGRGDVIASFGHPLYPEGDVRATSLLAALKPAAPIRRVLRAVAEETGEAPNCDAALAAMTRELGLPDEAPFAIFALSRMAGWLAHAMEQRETGRLIRPRARYTGDVV